MPAAAKLARAMGRISGAILLTACIVVPLHLVLPLAASSVRANRLYSCSAMAKLNSSFPA